MLKARCRRAAKSYCKRSRLMNTYSYTSSTTGSEWMRTRWAKYSDHSFRLARMGVGLVCRQRARLSRPIWVQSRFRVKRVRARDSQSRCPQPERRIRNPYKRLDDTMPYRARLGGTIILHYRARLGRAMILHYKRQRRDTAPAELDSAEP